MATHETINHPTIGPLKGIKLSSKVIQFLGIQYATLKDRFARGELLVQYPSAWGILDATKFGPLPLSPPDGCEHEQRIIQKSLPFEPFHQSDTQCLTLNISSPSLDGSKKLPVMVFVHGGAFATGSSSFPQCDLGPITNLSVELGTPMICVGINYRVGAPGFLYSLAMREAGYKTNNGLDDQRLALRWIKHHISGFGGDPDRITFLGESAGSASGCFHLHSPEPLFQQFIGMSGSSQQRLRRTEQAEASYQSVVGVLDAAALSPKGQVQKLIEIPGGELVGKVGRKFPMGPLIDGDIIPQGTTFSAIRNQDELTKLFPGLNHCKRVLFGDCQMDGMAFGMRVSKRTDILPKTMISILSKVFDPINPQIAKDIISAYGLDGKAESNTRENLEPILNYGNDVMFALPARELARGWSSSNIPGTEAFLCHFNAPNPWDGPWKGYATHIQDIAFALLGYNNTLSHGQRLCAERYAKDIIAFVNGTEPWPAYERAVREGAMVYDAPVEGGEDKSCYVPVEDPERTGRRDALYKIVGEELFDKLVDVWQLFMAGPK